MKDKCMLCDKEYDIKGLGYHLKTKHNVKVSDYIQKFYNIPVSVVDWRELSVKDAIFAKKMLEQHPQFNNYLDLFQHIYDEYNDLRKMNRAFGTESIGRLCICLGVKTNRNLSKEHKKKISNKRKGKPLSEEHKKAIGKGLLNQENKEIRYKNLSKKLKGHQHSKESIEKMIKNRSNTDKPFRGKAGIREDLGIYVRSTWEANFARVLKYMNVEFQFEPQIFWLTLPNGRELSYTPDFYLPKEDKYIEVKGYWMDDAKMKYDLFRAQYPHIKIDVVDSEKYKAYENRFKNQIEEWE